MMRKLVFRRIMEMDNVGDSKIGTTTPGGHDVSRKAGKVLSIMA